MGHTQFIPTTYAAYAVDFDGDGKRDIWNNIGDALASTANYLKKSGWQSGATWGYEVIVPKGFNYKLSSSERTLGAWQKLGLKRPGGKPFPRPSESARLFAPAGAGGPAFLLIKNFKVIKRYNNADAYALAVGHLSDRLRGGGEFSTEWPDADLRLSDSELMQVQQLLAQRGLYDGDIDGNIGSGSRAAIMSYQEAVGLEANGQVSQKLLEMLQSGK
jgi:membrane-bound lytic murein transglycosylase B